MSARKARHLSAVPTSPEHAGAIDGRDGDGAASGPTDASPPAAPSFEDIVLPEVDPQTQALWDKTDALFEGMTHEEHGDALARMYFNADGDPALPPTLRAVPERSSGSDPSADERI